MSVRYGQYVFPEGDSLFFRPSRPQLRRILAALSDLGWLRPERALTETERHLYISPVQAADKLDDVAPDALLDLWLAGGPPGRYPDVFSRGDRFGHIYCEDVTLYDSPVLAMLPSGGDGAELPCTSCSSDIYQHLSSVDLAAYPHLRGLLGNGFSVAPERCPRCHQAADLKAMTMVVGLNQVVAVPFAHLFLVFQAVHAPDEVVTLDPAVLAMLASECGVSFRETGLFQ